eukprot:g2457.t1
MTDHVIIYDTEFLTVDGAKSRLWCGPKDPDPCVVQIGAVKMSLKAGFELLATERIFIKTRDRYGVETLADPYFVELTGISQEQIDAEGIAPLEAVHQLDRFADGADLWSWGKDEMFLLAISCYVAGVVPPIPAHRCGNAGNLLLKAGMPYEDLQGTSSGELRDYFGLTGERQHRHHDALDDARSVALTLQHLLLAGKITVADFQLPPRPCT